MNTSYSNQKPGLFTAIAVMTLVSGVINLFWGFIASASALGSFFGIVCLPVTILPTILGVFEIIYAAKLLSTQVEPVKPAQSLAVFEILTFFIGNVFSMVVGILALIFYNDVSVKEYFAQINGSAAMPPAPVVVDQPEEISAPVEPVIIPDIVEEPAKPKRIRKIADK